MAEEQITALLGRQSRCPSRDHHQVVHDGKPVTGSCIGDGTEGGDLRFRGVKRPVAAISDKNASCCLAGGRPQDHGAGREAGCLDPADGDDGVADEAVTVVHVEDECHVLPAGAEQVPCDPRSRCRVVDPSGQVEPCLRYGVRVGRCPARVPGERSEEGVE